MLVRELFATFSSHYNWEISLYDVNDNTEIHTDTDTLDTIDEAWREAEICDWTCDGESFNVNVIK